MENLETSSVYPPEISGNWNEIIIDLNTVKETALIQKPSWTPPYGCQLVKEKKI